MVFNPVKANRKEGRLRLFAVSGARLAIAIPKQLAGEWFGEAATVDIQMGEGEDAGRLLLAPEGRFQLMRRDGDLMLSFPADLPDGGRFEALEPGWRRIDWGEGKAVTIDLPDWATDRAVADALVAEQAARRAERDEVLRRIRNREPRR